MEVFPMAVKSPRTEPPPQWVWPEDVVVIGLDVHVKPGSHPLYSPEEAVRLAEPLDHSFVRNIAHVGVIQAVLVRPEKIRGPDDVVQDRYVVVTGRRRIRHAREANVYLDSRGAPRRQVPITVLKLADKTAEIAIVSENLQRQAVVLPARISRAQTMIEAGHDEETVADAYGVAPRTIRQWCALAQADRVVWELYTTGRLTLVQCEEVGRFPKTEQADEARRIALTARTGVAPGEAGADEDVPDADPEDTRTSIRTRDAGGRALSRGRTAGISRGLQATTLQKMRAALGETPSGDLGVAAAVLEWVVTGQPPEHPIVVTIQRACAAREARKSPKASTKAAGTVGKDGTKGKKDKVKKSPPDLETLAVRPPVLVEAAVAADTSPAPAVVEDTSPAPAAVEAAPVGPAAVEDTSPAPAADVGRAVPPTMAQLMDALKAGIASA